MGDSTELTVGLHSKNANKIRIAGTALAAAVLGVFATHQLGPADRDIFERLLAAFGDENVKIGGDALSWVTTAGVLNVLGFAGLGAGVAYLLMRLVGPPRYIACAMTIALPLLYQWVVWGFTREPTHPIGFIAAFATGIVAGIYLRGYELQRRESEATYYELKLKNRELMETRLELLKQDEMERRILAADLHDQVLNDLKQVVQRFERYVESPDPENAEKIMVMTRQVMLEIREVMDSLSPSVLEHLGLGAAIEDCLRRGADRSGFRTRFKSRVDNEDLDVLSMVEKGLLYRLVQESITNICKHAGASTVRAVMENEEDELVIRVTDDGKGIDPGKALGESRGLKYMRYRADLIGATIAWKPGENGKGTTVEMRINLGDRRAAQAAAQQREQLEAQRTETQV
jgi:signal transduction histidine kinase